MAEKEKVLRLRLLGDKETQASLERLQRTVDVLGSKRRLLNQQERKGLITTKQASKQRLVLNTRLKVARTNLNALTRQQLLANGAIKRGTGLSKSISKGFANMALRIGGATAAFLLIRSAIGGAFNIVKDFQQASADLAAILGKTRSEITGLTDDAKRLGGTTKFTATEVAKLQKEFAKLGFSTKEILNATEATLDLAAATGTDLARAAEVTGATVRGFGLDASETQRVVDVMAKSFSSSALDMEKFATSMSKIAPVAKAVGLTIEETTGFMGTLADSGIEASTIGTSLRKIFIELSKKGLTLNDALDQIRNSQDKLNTAQKIFGVRAATAALVLAENADKAAILTAKLNLAGGAAKRMADEQLNTLEGKLTILNSAWEGFILSLDSGDGVMTNLVGTLAEFATGILSTLSGTKDLTRLLLEENEALENQTDSMFELLDRYDELKTKTELNEIEQEELKIIIEELALRVPEAASEFDKYNKVIDVNTESIRGNLERQQEVLRLKFKDRIKEVREELEKQNTTLEIAEKNFAAYQRGVSADEAGTAKWRSVLLDLNRVIAENELELNKLGVALTDAQKEFIDLTLGTDNFKDATRDLAVTAETTTDIIIGLSKKEIAAAKKKADAIAKEEERINKLRLKNSQIRLEIASAESQEELDRISADFENIKTDSKLRVDLLLSDAITRGEIRLIESETLNEERESRLEIEEARFRQEINTLGNRDAEIELATLKHNQKIEKIESDTNKSRLTAIANFGQAILGFASTLSTILENNKQQELRAAGDNAAKREEIEKDFAKKQKNLALTTAIISAAVGITRAFADYVYPASVGIAALVAISTGIEIAAIESAKFHKGGVLSGSSHEQGGVPFSIGGRLGFEAEGGEAIINKRSTSKYGSILSAINQAEGGVAFDRGGQVPLHKFRHGSVTPTPTFTDSAILARQQASIETEEITDAISVANETRKVVNVVSDTTEGQESIANVVSEASIG